MFRGRPCLALEPLIWIVRRWWGMIKQSWAALMTSGAAAKVIAEIITSRISCSFLQRGQLDGVVCPKSGLSESGEGEDTGHPLVVLIGEASVSTKQRRRGYRTAQHPTSKTDCIGVCLWRENIYRLKIKRWSREGGSVKSKRREVEPQTDGGKRKERQTQWRLISWPADNSSFSEPQLWKRVGVSLWGAWARGSAVHPIILWLQVSCRCSKNNKNKNKQLSI